MTTDEVTVIIAAHPARMRSGLLTRAFQSVMMQTYPVTAISIAVDQEKQGAAPTRQRALDAVTTEWTAIIDSDDVWRANHLSVLMRCAKDTGADFVYSGFETIPVGGRVFPETHFTNDFDPADPIETTITVLVRTGIAKQVGYVALDRGEINSGEDRHFTLGCLELGAKIVCAKQKTWYYDIGSQGQNTSGLPGRGDSTR